MTFIFLLISFSFSETSRCRIKQRYVVGFMGFFALANGYIQRFCLSLAITEMVATHRLHHTKIDPNACPLDTVITTNGTIHVSIVHIFNIYFVLIRRYC